MVLSFVEALEGSVSKSEEFRQDYQRS